MCITVTYFTDVTVLFDVSLVFSIVGDALQALICCLLFIVKQLDLVCENDSLPTESPDTPSDDNQAVFVDLGTPTVRVHYCLCTLYSLNMLFTQCINACICYVNHQTVLNYVILHIFCDPQHCCCLIVDFLSSDFLEKPLAYA